MAAQHLADPAPTGGAAGRADHVIAIDQGTTSTRVIVFDRRAKAVASAQREHRQIFERPGWVGHDAIEIWRTTEALLREALGKARIAKDRIAGIGITNQRETTVVWDAATGEPIGDAIVWQDTRTQGIVDALAAEVDPATGQPYGTERLRAITGLPLASYFSAGKVRWMLDEIPGARERAERGELRFGTIDSWLVYNLTGGAEHGLHVTDVTNASRTQLCDLRTLDWSEEALDVFGIPRSMLPGIVSSSEQIGEVRGIAGLDGVPIAGILGDQQAATFGQAAFAPGSAKQTFGTGGFLIVNTGERPVFSQNGLLTTVAYRIGNASPVYALEGSVAVAGSLHHWLRDNLGLIRDSTEIEGLASSVPDTGGAYIVPAFSGLFAPRWQPDARGVIVGLTRFVTKAHLVRAASEACAFQTVEVIDAAAADTGEALDELRVDGGGSASDMMMQFQADLLGIDVVRPENLETTALGAAFAAGLATGVWSGTAELQGLVREGRRWTPRMAAADRARSLRLWGRAVERSLGWVDDDVRAAGGAGS
ncbi:glycerol kinase GlpK [Leucobacter soli]|uniref:Glycerol kinase n=1 Tax=Leucobacter soli TaxID=2812850 RepID=A0A916JX31_9MICO|nr:glycerol kinase GlpK [Leucobacter soli]CAG7612140.1 Glycerol kinase [Leucobacter soli]